MMLTGLYAFSQRSHKNKRSLARSWLKIGDSPVVLHKLQTNPVGFTNSVVFTITRCHLGFWISNKTQEWWSLPWLQRSACYEKLHCLFAFNHLNFDLDPKSFINQSRWPSMLQSSSNGLHLALGMWDPLKCNLAEAYFSKQGKVPVISFIGASKTCSLGFTQRLMSGKINTSFTVPAETPGP